MKTDFFKTARVPLVITILLSFLLTSAQLAYAGENLPNGQCECVTYVVFSLYGRRLSGNWPDAKSMANPNFWSAAHMKENGLSTSLARTSSNTAKSGDVVIFQSDATYSVRSLVTYWDQQTKRYVSQEQWQKQTSAGYGSGHIGLVLSANYSSKERGWFITMASANWPEEWGKYIQNASPYNEPPQFYDKTYFECRNVSSQQYIFVPNGSKISFWRLEK